MADKKKSGVSVQPTFVGGEQPTADKFNAISVQLGRTSYELEKSVGDIYGESYPYTDVTDTRLTLPQGRNYSGPGEVSSADTKGPYLDIANLGRVIGAASNLNPLLPCSYSDSSDYVFTVTEESLATFEADSKEFRTIFMVADPTIATLSGTYATANLTNKVDTHDLVKEDGDWCITSDRKFTCFTPIPSGTSVYISYTTTPTSWGCGPSVPGSSHNVIPDPSQIEAGGNACTATLTGSYYTITLPELSHARTNYNNTSTLLNGDGDIGYGAQLTLPKVLVDNFSPGDVIPSGFLLIRDNTTGKVYSDGIYIYNNESTLFVSNVTLDTSHEFSVITVGASLTDAISDLQYKLYHHTHGGTFGEKNVHVSNLSGVLESVGTKGAYVDSSIPINWMPQYLHRDGYVTDSDANDDNSLRGHLVIGRLDGEPGTYVGNTGASYKLYYGSITGPYIYKSAADVLAAVNPLGDVWITAETDLRVTSANGNLYLQATNGEVNITALDGDLTLRSENGDIVCKNGVYIEHDGLLDVVDATRTHIAHAAFAIKEGNIDSSFSAQTLQGLAVGHVSVSASNVYSISENGSSPMSGTSDGTGSFPYATTEQTGNPDNDAWKVPLMQQVFLSQQNVEFEGYDKDHNVTTTYSDIEYWMAEWNLPNYLYSFAGFGNGSAPHGANAILGLNVLVKSEYRNTLWFTTGAGRFGENSGGVDRGEKIHAYIIYDGSSAVGNKIRIVIGADGATDGQMQSFHKDMHGSAVTISVDVKILLTVAAPVGNFFSLLP